MKHEAFRNVNKFRIKKFISVGRGEIKIKIKITFDLNLFLLSKSNGVNKQYCISIVIVYVQVH